MGIDELKEKIKMVVRPAVLPFQDETLLDEIADNVASRAEFIASLDDSHSPLDEVVQQCYQSIEQELTNYRQTLLFNPGGVKASVRSRSGEDERYAVLTRVVEALLLRDARGYFERFDEHSTHFARYPLTSFSSVRTTLDAGEVEIGIAVGPEGFMYASIFELFGFPVRNIHIDEYCATEDRPYRELDDISDIRGKHVLFIEDDVQTGRTLEKAYRMISRYSPASVSVYLGTPEKGQKLGNVPRELRATYTTPNFLPDAEARLEVDKAIELLEKRYRIFKDSN